jgi:hypothetical protein
VKFGDDVKLDASVDINASLFIWLKKAHFNHRVVILRESGDLASGQVRTDSYELKKFSKDDEGHYELIVATEQTVGRRTFQLRGKELHLRFCNNSYLS